MLAAKLKELWQMPLHDRINFFKRSFYRYRSALYYRRVFGSFGKGSILYKPMHIGNPRFIHIGNKVEIRPGVRLEGVLLDPANPPELRIGNNVNIEQNVHIVFVGKVHIEDNVSIMANCALLGGNHPFLNVDDPVKIGDRLTGAKSLMVIGAGSFLGIGCVIGMNVKIGRYTILGAGSIVKKNLPGYCVADGNPAKVSLQYDHEKKSWHPVQPTE